MSQHSTSVADRAQLLSSGVLVVRDFWDPGSVRVIQGNSTALGLRARQQLETISASGCSIADWVRQNEDDLIVSPEASDPTRVCRFEYILEGDAGIAQLVRSKLVPTIGGLLGERVVPFKDKQNEKAPGGGAFRPHQDFAAYQSFGPLYHITAMVSVDTATIENGCLEFAINWTELARCNPDLVLRHIEGRALFHFYGGGSKNGDIRDDIANRLIWEPIETQPADIVLFDSFVPHRSAPNASTSSRRAMFLTFNAEREGDWYARYYRDKRRHYDHPKFHVSTPTTHAGSTLPQVS
jgi:ectoine hydroxylase-related dioxygenase (phytanoyl-CoA dioxygenase family)